jgi:protoporphyrinogen oxidase
MTDVITKLPLTTVARAGLSWAWHSLILGRLTKPPQETSETVLRRAYGQVLSEIFFKHYIERVWGVSPAYFSPAFARQRIPKMQIMELLGGLLAKLRGQTGREVRTDDFVETLDGTFYSTPQGFSLITDRLAADVTAKGGELRLGARVTGLERQGGRVTTVAYEQDGQALTLPCAGVVSTLPVNLLPSMLHPAPPKDVLDAASSLNFRPTVFVGLLVNRPRVLPASFMYFREHSFNRISDLAQFGIKIEPPGHTILVAEITCEEGERPWTDDGFAKESVLKELQAEGLLRSREVVESHVYRAAQAYPVYRLGYEEQLGRCLDYLEGLDNLQAAGRQGRFQYINAHVALKMGQEAAARLAKKLDPPAS